jgi:4-amino-4-deoxy-L-arabinose transferase-like glycosyltransferase
MGTRGDAGRLPGGASIRHGRLLAQALIEFSLMALSSLAILLLMESDVFERRRSSLALGVVLGVGLLFKPNFGFYLWLPVGLTGVVALVRRRPGSMLNAALAAILAVGIPATWYLPQIESILLLSRVNSADALTRGHTLDRWRAFLEYLEALAAYLMTGIGALLAAVGMGADLLTRWQRTWVLHAWVVGSWLIVILALVYRDPKYLLPCLPALALFTASLVGRLPQVARRAGAVALVGFMAVHFSIATFGVPTIQARALKLGSLDLALWSSQYYWGGRDGRGQWGHSEVVEAVAQRHPRGATVAVVTNMEWFNVNILTWEARRRRLDMSFSLVGDAQLPGPDFDEMDRFTYVVLKSGNQGAPHIAELPNSRARGSGLSLSDTSR